VSEEIESSSPVVDRLNTYLSRPAGGSRAGMLLLPMISGISARVREFADGFAQAGITALCWDPWQGRPSGDRTSMEVLLGWMGALDDEACLAEQRRLLDHLFGELGCTRAGVIGWCMGGRFALLLGGRDDRLANVTAYHPTVPGTPAPNHTLDAAELCGAIRAPVMMLYPGADELVPQRSFQRLQSALQSRASGPSIVHVYPGAEHGFSGSTRLHSAVNTEAFTISWPQAIQFAVTTTADG
jgi:carboxymethylenebutenolidase